MEEHCPQPGLPALEDFVIVAEALSQVKSVPLVARQSGVEVDGDKKVTKIDCNIMTFVDFDFEASVDKTQYASKQRVEETCASFVRQILMQVHTSFCTADLCSFRCKKLVQEKKLAQFLVRPFAATLAETITRCINRIFRHLGQLSLLSLRGRYRVPA